MKKLPRHVVDTNRNMFNKYMRILKKVRKVIWSINDKDVRKRLEVEVAYLTNKIDSYGFTFFPDMYVDPVIDELQMIINKHK